MRIVGDSLSDIAISETEKGIGSLYAKSAYNRYYYHCYLAIREEISSLTPIDKLGHGGNVGSVMHSNYKLHILRSLDSSGLPDSEDQKNNVNAIVKDIARLLEKLFKIRAAADYDHNASLNFLGRDIEINFLDGKHSRKHTLSEVISDLEVITSHLQQIQKIKKQVGLI